MEIDIKNRVDRVLNHLADISIQNFPVKLSWIDYGLYSSILPTSPCLGTVCILLERNLSSDDVISLEPTAGGRSILGSYSVIAVNSVISVNGDWVYILMFIIGCMTLG